MNPFEMREDRAAAPAGLNEEAPALVPPFNLIVLEPEPACESASAAKRIVSTEATVNAAFSMLNKYVSLLLLNI